MKVSESLRWNSRPINLGEMRSLGYQGNLVGYGQSRGGVSQNFVGVE